MSNSLWQIAFGPYALIVDRRTLRFDLRDIKADIKWAESLPLGWIELENIETGETSRHEFGDCKIISVSEKAGAQGKRILFGLDAPGPVPIDVYVICTEREIQLTVEASRDGKTHRVTGFGLVPGLMSVPDDGASYLVLPSGEGSGILARDVTETTKWRHPIWQSGGVFMPFVGAVHAKSGSESVADAPAGSLALITDSAYGAFVLSRQSNGGAALDTHYERDPERRRLDARLVVLPSENHVGIARAYRDKIIGEKNHVTLRRKIRERPIVDKLIGTAWYVRASPFQKIGTSKRWLEKNEGKNKRWYLPEASVMWGDAANTMSFVEVQTDRDSDFFKPAIPGDIVALQLSNTPLGNKTVRWETIDESLQEIAQAQQNADLPVGFHEAGDWQTIACDFMVPPPSTESSFSLPLISVVYHDGLVMPQRNVGPELEEDNQFLMALLHLSPGLFYKAAYDKISGSTEKSVAEALAKDQQKRIGTYLVLSPLHRLTFTAFLTEHRFLTPDALVEEAVYSDKTRIVINRSDANAYETPELHLPPGGFWVRHAQMEAHDALRVGEQTFTERAFRIRRALDGKPLEQSADIETQEFLV